MKKKVNKAKKIESILSPKIKNVYQEQLEHQPQQISYKLFDRTLVIILEGIITSRERLLKDNDRIDLAKEVREAVDNVICPQIQEIFRADTRC